MTEATSKLKSEPEKLNISMNMAKTYWRLRLYNVLREKMLLRMVEMDGNSLQFTIVHWDEYWVNTPRMFRSNVCNLSKTWNEYIDSGFDISHAKQYCEAYLDLIRDVVKRKNMSALSYQKFLGRVLGFENFILKSHSSPMAFAAATTSFRNPAFLSFYHIGVRKHSRNDPCLLPLIVATYENVTALFYHYRKQRILKNTDDNLLFFPVVELKSRTASFRGLDTLTENLVYQWDSRVEQRSHLLAEKILVPLLAQVPKAKTQNKRRALRILDIGSGVGLFTSKVISKVVNSGVLGARKIELSLLDILSVDPSKHFSTRAILPGLSKVEYISSDYIEWLSRSNADRISKFDIVFLFRILHNLSLFKISARSMDSVHSKLSQDRYPVFTHMSDYYSAISLLFPDMLVQETGSLNDSSLFQPSRVFNASSLITHDDSSLIEWMSKISEGILIEDGDLSPDVLAKHMYQHVQSNIKVYDLSRPLRLSINHIYWVTNSRNDFPLLSEMIWPT